MTTTSNLVQNQSLRRWIVPTVVAAATIGLVTVISVQHHNTPGVKAATDTSILSSDEYQARLASPNVTPTLTFDAGKLVDGPTTITVHQGDSVHVTLVNKSADELKAVLPRYDIRTESENFAGAEGGFAFVADKAGTFPFYTEAASNGVDLAPNETPARTQIGVIVVQ